MQDPQHIISIARSRKKETKKFLETLKKLPAQKLDTLFHDAHEAVFTTTDCLSCANCCKGTGPLFTSKDVERIAGHLRMKAGDFTEKFLRIDEDNDYVLKTVPCSFLMEDNRCSIYDVRPKACREFPHTDRRDMRQILDLTAKNASVCPAVFTILEKIRAVI